jgi:hypothetical protein
MGATRMVQADGLWKWRDGIRQRVHPAACRAGLTLWAVLRFRVALPLVERKDFVSTNGRIVRNFRRPQYSQAGVRTL